MFRTCWSRKVLGLPDPDSYVIICTDLELSFSKQEKEDKAAKNWADYEHLNSFREGNLTFVDGTEILNLRIDEKIWSFLGASNAAEILFFILAGMDLFIGWDSSRLFHPLPQVCETGERA